MAEARLMGLASRLALQRYVRMKPASFFARYFVTSLQSVGQ